VGLKRLPSMREKKRYVVFRVVSEQGVDYRTVRDALWNSMTHWIGEAGLARANIRILRNLWNQREQSGFIQVSPKYVDAVKVAMGLIHQIGDQRVIFQSIRVSGTIKSGRAKAGPQRHRRGPRAN
jgi:RNase P/RNase MRP subunit POP5